MITTCKGDREDHLIANITYTNILTDQYICQPAIYIYTDIILVLIEPVEYSSLTGHKGINDILLEEVAPIKEGRILVLVRAVLDMQPVVVVYILLEAELLLCLLAFTEL
jgi:hypothetical protein